MSPQSRESLSVYVGKDDRFAGLEALEDYWKSVQHTYRRRWWQIWRPSNPPPPPVANMGDAPEIPLAMFDSPELALPMMAF